MVKLLLENGYVHTNGDDSLSLAASNGHLEVVEFLFDYGADIHVRDSQPLRWAASNGHTEVVEFLLENGANVHANDDEALRWANKRGYRRGYDDIVKLLEEASDENIT